MNQNFKILLIVLLLAAMAGGIYYIWTANRQMDEENENQILYRNEEFGFELEYPPGWTVSEELQLGTPIINVHKTDSPQILPYIHHTNVTQMSVFPHGVPTEGVFGETEEADLDLRETPERAIYFTLADGTPWAAMVIFENRPEDWQFGFIWAAAEIHNHEPFCFRNGNEIPVEFCDPLTGDQVSHGGEIDNSDWDAVMHILSSFRFLRP